MWVPCPTTKGWSIKSAHHATRKGLNMGTEIRVVSTLYYNVETNSHTEAVKEVKQLVAEELNGNVSEWSRYEVVTNA